ncbi:MAG: hypothetical protein IKF11_09470, partial [Methanobrevibacter sp.]|nr:hypothetical protein [Methanobrevibacter sp.]
MIMLVSTTVVFAQDNDTSLIKTNVVDSVELSSTDEKIDSKISNDVNNDSKISNDVNNDSRISINDVSNDSFRSNGDESDLQYSSDNEDKLSITSSLTVLKNLINSASGEVTFDRDYQYSSSTDANANIATYTGGNFILNGDGHSIRYLQNNWANPK